MAYYRDLSKITLEDYKSILKTTRLLPSWRILETDIEKNMDKIISLEINNLEELKTTLKTPKKVQNFSEKSGLNVQYVKVLRRVINGYHPKPNSIALFPGIDKEVKEKLNSNGYKTSLDIYKLLLTEESRIKWAEENEINLEISYKLARFSDLSRIRWVNHTFAYLLMECRYVSVEQISQSDPEKIYKDIKQFNSEKNIFMGAIGKNDMFLVVELAGELDRDMIWP